MTMVALLSVMESGENEYGICKIARGPILNLFLFSRSEKILLGAELLKSSSDSRWTLTVDGSLKGFLKVNMEEVLLPTAVEIG